MAAPNAAITWRRHQRSEWVYIHIGRSLTDKKVPQLDDKVPVLLPTVTMCGKRILDRWHIRWMTAHEVRSSLDQSGFARSVTNGEARYGSLCWSCWDKAYIAEWRTDADH